MEKANGRTGRLLAMMDASAEGSFREAKQNDFGRWQGWLLIGQRVLNNFEKCSCRNVGKKQNATLGLKQIECATL